FSVAPCGQDNLFPNVHPTSAERKQASGRWCAAAFFRSLATAKSGPRSADFHEFALSQKRIPLGVDNLTCLGRGFDFRRRYGQVILISPVRSRVPTKPLLTPEYSSQK